MSAESPGAGRLSGPASPPAVELLGAGKRYETYGRPHQRLLQTLLRGRRRFYREFWALADITLTVGRGETVGIVGRNGSGKSTLLQLVAGTLAPSAGTVRTTGRVAALLELGSGFNPEFTGRENVYLNGAILGMSRRQVEEAFRPIEAFAEIGDFIDQPLKTYSSGMVVRLAFAVAVHVTPDVLIVDEALGVGDTAFQSKCLDRIRRMQRDGVAILLVSHDSNAIVEFCDRAVYLDRGRLVAAGACRDILERYTEDVISAAGGISISGRPTPAQEPPVRADGSAARRPGTTDGARPPTEIIGVTVTDANGAPRHAFSHGEPLHIRLDVIHHADNASPCFGIQVKSPEDIVLWVCTTHLMNLALPARKAGERATYEWQLRANVGGGRYVLAVGSGDSSSGQYMPHYRLHYAGHFDVIPEPRRGQGWIEPESRFVVGSVAAVERV